MIWRHEAQYVHAARLVYRSRVAEAAVFYGVSAPLDRTCTDANMLLCSSKQQVQSGRPTTGLGWHSNDFEPDLNLKLSDYTQNAESIKLKYKNQHVHSRKVLAATLHPDMNPTAKYTQPEMRHGCERNCYDS